MTSMMNQTRMNAAPHLCVILPAYNEALSITNTVKNIATTLEKLTPFWNVVVIDDGSRDTTAATVRNLPQTLNTTLVRFSRNFGKEYAITAGLSYAKGDIVICMDADGQHGATLLVEMLAKWREGYDMVYAVREDREVESKFKKWGSKIFYRIMSGNTRFDIPKDAGDFRLMDRKVVDALCALPERNRFMKGIYAWVGYSSIGIPYTPLPREYGESAFSRLKLLSLAWTGITSFSVMPLRLSSATGVLLALISFGYGLLVVIDHLFFNKSIPGWPTVVAGMMFLSGVQLLFIGILGEYLARIYDEVKGRPPYIVAEVSPPRQVEFSELENVDKKTAQKRVSQTKIQSEIKSNTVSLTSDVGKTITKAKTKKPLV